MDTYAQRTGHYSEEQEKERGKFRERLSGVGAMKPDQQGPVTNSLPKMGIKDNLCP